jgi:hypothetical protein
MPRDRSIEETRLRLQMIAAALKRMVDDADDIEEHLVGAKLADGLVETERRLADIKGS